MSMKIYADAQKFAKTWQKTALKKHGLPKYIKSLMKAVNEKAFSENETALSETVKENIGLLSEMAQSAKRGFEYRKKLPLSNGMPFIYACVKNYMKKSDYCYNHDTFCEYMSVDVKIARLKIMK